MENHYTLLGAPGSGKTTTLVGRIAKAVGESLYGGDILICSLTRTAAHEIAERVKEKVPGVEFPHVGTVHALALRALKAIGENPRLVYDEELIRDFNQETGRRLPLNLGNVMHDPEGANSSLKTMADMDRRRAAEQPTAEWPESAAHFYDQWENWKSASGLMDFTDLIHRATMVCQEHPAAPRYIFVDEAQDLSKLEMRLVKQWAETTEKTIIAGDDQQALYEWRGASVSDFIHFAPKENQYVLPRSYRMSEAIYQKARTFGDRIHLKIEKDFKPVGEGGVVMNRMFMDVLSNVESDVEHMSVMLLATCGYMLNPYLKELKIKGIPYHNPYRSRAEGKTWNPLKSRHADAYRIFLMPSEGQHMWTWGQLYKLVSMMKAPPAGLLTELRANKLVRGTVPPGIVDAFDLGVFLEAARAGCYHTFFDMLENRHRHGPGGSLSPMAYIKRVLDTHGRSALDARPQLIVGTIHSVKGGEADAVYVLPNISPEAYRNMNSRAGMDSLLRTFYVGVSRARRKLVLVTVPGERRAMWR